MKHVSNIPIWVRKVILAALATVPVVWFSFRAGTFRPGAVEEPLLTDYEALGRMFLVLPFLLLIDGAFKDRFERFLVHTQSMIQQDFKTRATDFSHKIIRLLRSPTPELILFTLIIIYTLGFKELLLSNTDGWYGSIKTAEVDLSLAGYWFMYVVVPIYQFLFARWMWRWMVWVSALVYFNSMKWNLNALHGDQMAGLEYLNELPVLFSFIGLALGTNLAAYMLEAIGSGGQHLLDFRFTIILTCLLIPGFFFAPLTVFFRKLSISRSRAIDDYGRLIHFHHRYFRAKWYGQSEEKVAQIVGSPDPSSLADINGGYDALRYMKIIPVNYRVFGLMVLAQVLPFLPLLGTTYSLKQLVTTLIQGIG